MLALIDLNMEAAVHFGKLLNDDIIAPIDAL